MRAVLKQTSYNNLFDNSYFSSSEFGRRARPVHISYLVEGGAARCQAVVEPKGLQAGTLKLRLEKLTKRTGQSQVPLALPCRRLFPRKDDEVTRSGGGLRRIVALLGQSGDADPG